MTRNPTALAAIAPATTARTRWRAATMAKGTTAAASRMPPRGTSCPTTVSASDMSARTTPSASSPARSGPELGGEAEVRRGGRMPAQPRVRVASSPHSPVMRRRGRSPTVQSEVTRAPAQRADAAFEAVLARARDGAPSAWDQLFRQFAPAVAGYLRLRGAAEPDDLTSEVFIAVFRNLASFTGTEANFRSWIFVIAHRRLQDERRRRTRRPALSDEHFDESRSAAVGDVED